MKEYFEAIFMRRIKIKLKAFSQIYCEKAFINQTTSLFGKSCL